MISSDNTISTRAALVFYFTCDVFEYRPPIRAKTRLLFRCVVQLIAKICNSSVALIIYRGTNLTFLITG